MDNNNNNNNRSSRWGNTRTQSIKKFNRGFINYTMPTEPDIGIKYIRTYVDGNKKYLSRDDVYDFVGNVEIGFDFKGLTILMVGILDKGKFFPSTTNTPSTPSPPKEGPAGN